MLDRCDCGRVRALHLTGDPCAFRPPARILLRSDGHAYSHLDTVSCSSCAPPPRLLRRPLLLRDLTA